MNQLKNIVFEELPLGKKNLPEIVCLFLLFAQLPIGSPVTLRMFLKIKRNRSFRLKNSNFKHNDQTIKV